MFTLKLKVRRLGSPATAFPPVFMLGKVTEARTCEKVQRGSIMSKSLIQASRTFLRLQNNDELENRP